MLKKVTAVTAFAVFVCIGQVGLADDAPVYELRTYFANEGKINALHDRFRNHTIDIFARHGMQSVAYWTPADDPNKLIYVIKHKSQATIEDSWKAFVADPEWQKVYADSIADGRLVAKIENTFMTKTPYSP